LKKAGISRILIERTPKRAVITINTSRPGIVIGRSGKEISQLEEELKKITNKEVKILMPDGTEVAAKVAFKDPDLDLAFIRPEKPESVKLTPVNTANAAPMAVLDDVIILGRLGKDLNREPVVMTNEVISLVSKPRVFAKVGAQMLGMPAFNQDGKFLGVGINRFSAKGDSDSQGPMPSNVILPAADLLESAAQAK